MDRLDIEQCSIGDAGMAALAASPVIGQLEELDVGHNRFSDDGLARLAAADAPRLRGLDLAGGFADWGDRGLGALLESPIARRLVYLGLNGARVSDACVARLLEPGAAPSLRWIDVAGATLGDEIRSALEDRFVCEAAYDRWELDR